MEFDRCGRLVSKPKTRDVTPFDLALVPKLKEELKSKHLNDLHELRLESTKIVYSHPVECLIKIPISSVAQAT